MPAEAAQKVLDAVTGMQTMEPLSGPSADYMGKANVQSPGTGIWATPGAKQTLDAHFNAIRIARESGTLWDNITRQMKMGLTSLNLAGSKNNVVSNTLLDSVVRGTNPIASAAEAAAADRSYTRFLKNESATPAERAMWKSAVNNGMPTMSQLDAYFGKVKGAFRGGEAKSVGARIQSAQQGIQRIFGGMYSKGDMAFKLLSFKRSYMAAMDDLATLSEGRSVTFAGQHGDTMTFRKVPGGLEVNGKVLRPGSQELADLVGQNALKDALPELMGGSADLSPSNMTALKNEKDFQKATPAGRYLRFGVREHAMVAICNGMVAYGAILPFCGTFLNFIGYALGAVRLSALSHFRVLYVATHDSIGLGEDGPTHQPVEMMEALRATPNT
jgi:hypothetical protein